MADYEVRIASQISGLTGGAGGGALKDKKTQQSNQEKNWCESQIK